MSPSPAFDAGYVYPPSKGDEFVSMDGAASERRDYPARRLRKSRSRMSRSIWAWQDIIEKCQPERKTGEFLCIIGASGCGKTLRCALRRDYISRTSGRVTFDEEPMLMPRAATSPSCFRTTAGRCAMAEPRGISRWR